MTPTEILTAHRAGAHMVKVFPSNVLGPRYIKSLRGRFRSYGSCRPAVSMWKVSRNISAQESLESASAASFSNANGWNKELGRNRKES